MQSKYLSSDPVPWLLEKNDPCIRYLTQRDIVNNNPDMDYDTLFTSPEIKKLQEMTKNCIIGSLDRFDLYYKGAIWCFAEAVERGLDKRTGAIKKTAAFITDRCQLSSGGFTLNWKPEAETAIITGEILKYMILAGFDDQRIENGISWILKNQRHDGGWLYSPVSGLSDSLRLTLFRKSGNGLMLEKDKSVRSGLPATLSCTYALLLHKKKDDSHESAIKQASNFILDSLVSEDCDPLIKNPGYPVLSAYDELYALLTVFRAGFSEDKRVGKTFNRIISRQNPDGTWNLENACAGMLYGNCRTPPLGKKNKWVTLNILRLLKYTSKSPNSEKHSLLK